MTGDKELSEELLHKQFPWAYYRLTTARDRRGPGGGYCYVNIFVSKYMP